RLGYWDSQARHVRSLDRDQIRKLTLLMSKRDIRLNKTGLELSPVLLSLQLGHLYWPDNSSGVPDVDNMPLGLAGISASGLLANPEFSENAVLEDLEHATYEDLLEARQAYYQYCFAVAVSANVFQMSDEDANALFASVTHGDWLISTLAGLTAEAIRRRLRK